MENFVIMMNRESVWLKLCISKLRRGILGRDRIGKAEKKKWKRISSGSFPRGWLNFLRLLSNPQVHGESTVDSIEVQLFLYTEPESKDRGLFLLGEKKCG